MHPLEPVQPLDEETLAACTNVVALAGVEQLDAALATGADIVLAGRSTDTAPICALPLRRGEHPGAAWHGAKVTECGALCSTYPTSGVVLVEVDEPWWCTLYVWMGPGSYSASHMASQSPPNR